jgi:pantoate--beta-alanine ligase
LLFVITFATYDKVLKDLLTAYPTTDNLHIIPTTRDTSDHLALSSRNAYLTEAERPYAPTLHRALSQVRSSLTSNSPSTSAPTTAESAIQAARDLIENASTEASSSSNVSIKYDYIEVFDKVTFEPIRGELRGREAVVAGAIWVGKTRLIDNLLIGWDV